MKIYFHEMCVCACEGLLVMYRYFREAVVVMFSYSFASITSLCSEFYFALLLYSCLGPC